MWEELKRYTRGIMRPCVVCWLSTYSPSEVSGVINHRCLETSIRTVRFVGNLLGTKELWFMGDYRGKANTLPQRNICEPLKEHRDFKASITERSEVSTLCMIQ